MEKRLAITIGDCAGVGPEIILKAMPSYLDEVIVYGSFDVLSFYNEKHAYHYPLLKIDEPKDALEKHLNIIDCADLKMKDFNIGALSPACGKAAYLYLENAVKDAMSQKVKAIVTCPLNKEALHAGGYNYAGHTEILGQLTGTKNYAMLLWSERLKTIHVSTHVSLKTAIERVQKKRIIDVTLLAKQILTNAGYENPRIAIAGLNPHAGENGLFGDEEIREIIPAVSELKTMGLNVEGPIAPDTVFLRCYKGEYDLVVAMYHDQGHIPLKLADFDGGVNITCGLPIIRTSVDHGTAFDIAGTNKAREDSLLQALAIAEKIA